MLVALLMAQGAMAQKRSVTMVVTDSVTVKTIVLPNFVPQHDLRVGVGTISLPGILMLGELQLCSGPNPFAETVADAEFYKTPRYFVGNYSLSYLYHDRRWLQYGATLVFGASTSRLKSSSTNEVVMRRDRCLFSVMPTVRFNWFYREKVQLYSSVAVALVTDFDGAYLWGDVTLVGCSFGRKFFGFTELGLGMSGWGRAGVGYRFDAVKKQK